MLGEEVGCPKVVGPFGFLNGGPPTPARGAEPDASARAALDAATADDEGAEDADGVALEMGGAPLAWTLGSVTGSGGDAETVAELGVPWPATPVAEVLWENTKNAAPPPITSISMLTAIGTFIPEPDGGAAGAADSSARRPAMLE